MLYRIEGCQETKDLFPSPNYQFYLFTNVKFYFEEKKYGASQYIMYYPLF